MQGKAGLFHVLRLKLGARLGGSQLHVFKKKIYWLGSYRVHVDGILRTQNVCCLAQVFEREKKDTCGEEHVGFGLMLS